MKKKEQIRTQSNIYSKQCMHFGFGKKWNDFFMNSVYKIEKAFTANNKKQTTQQQKFAFI